MAQDKIFMTGKLQEYKDAFRWDGAGLAMWLGGCHCGTMPQVGYGLLWAAAVRGPCPSLPHYRRWLSWPACLPMHPPAHPPHCRAVDSGGNGTISATELFQLFQRLDQPVRCLPD